MKYPIFFLSIILASCNSLNSTDHELYAFELLNANLTISCDGFKQRKFSKKDINLISQNNNQFLRFISLLSGIENRNWNPHYSGGFEDYETYLKTINWYVNNHRYISFPLWQEFKEMDMKMPDSRLIKIWIDNGDYEIRLENYIDSLNLEMDLLGKRFRENPMKLKLEMEEKYKNDKYNTIR